MSAIVSLGHWLSSRFESGLINYAPGIAAGFSAWFAVRGGSGSQTQEVVYLGNSDGSTGWQFVRLADIAEAAPQGRLVPIQIRIGDSAPALVVADAQIPLALWLGRIHLFGMTLNTARNELALWANGARLTGPSIFVNALVPGASNLGFGVQSGDQCTDTIVAGAYSSYTGADLGEADLVHATIYDAFKRQTSGKVLFNALTLAEELTGTTIPRETVYDAWSLRGPYLITPSTLVNEGTDGAVGDLTFNGSDLLEPQVDQLPCYAGPLVVDSGENPFDLLTAWFRADEVELIGSEGEQFLAAMIGLVGTEGNLVADPDLTIDAPVEDPLLNNQAAFPVPAGTILLSDQPPSFWDFIGGQTWTGYIVHYPTNADPNSLLTTSVDSLFIQPNPTAEDLTFSLGAAGNTGVLTESYGGDPTNVAQYTKIIVNEPDDLITLANTMAGVTTAPFANPSPGVVGASLQVGDAALTGEFVIAEILLWDIVLTPSQQTAVETYLNTRYGLPPP